MFVRRCGELPSRGAIVLIEKNQEEGGGWLTMFSAVETLRFTGDDIESGLTTSSPTKISNRCDSCFCSLVLVVSSDRQANWTLTPPTTPEAPCRLRGDG